MQFWPEAVEPGAGLHYFMGTLGIGAPWQQNLDIGTCEL